MSVGHSEEVSIHAPARGATVGPSNPFYKRVLEPFSENPILLPRFTHYNEYLFPGNVLPAPIANPPGISCSLMVRNQSLGSALLLLYRGGASVSSCPDRVWFPFVYGLFLPNLSQTSLPIAERRT